MEMARSEQIKPSLKRLLRRIAKNIIKLRKSRHWTQEEVAEIGNFDLRWYQRIESGDYVFSMITLVRLAELFKIDPKDLLAL